VQRDSEVRFRNLAHVDQLTGLPNGRAFNRPESSSLQLSHRSLPPINCFRALGREAAFPHLPSFVELKFP